MHETSTMMKMVIIISINKMNHLMIASHIQYILYSNTLITHPLSFHHLIFYLQNTMIRYKIPVPFCLTITIIYDPYIMNHFKDYNLMNYIVYNCNHIPPLTQNKDDTIDNITIHPILLIYNHYILVFIFCDSMRNISFISNTGNIGYHIHTLEMLSNFILTIMNNAFLFIVAIFIQQLPYYIQLIHFILDLMDLLIHHLFLDNIHTKSIHILPRYYQLIYLILILINISFKSVMMPLIIPFFLNSIYIQSNQIKIHFKYFIGTIFNFHSHISFISFSILYPFTFISPQIVPGFGFNSPPKYTNEC